jgi:4-diphosphocytidyl-2C-methyl-D-erythritol kinase
MVPQVAVSTAQLFALLRLRHPHLGTSEDRALQSYCTDTTDLTHEQTLITLIENDFETAVCELAPEVARGLAYARQFFPRSTAVSGSGSAFFSLVPPEDAAQVDALCSAVRAAGYTVHRCSFVDSLTSLQETGR